jgi:tetratricopeptide (TPR) repeat protein
MRFDSLKYIFFVLSLGFFIPCSNAQKEIIDTVEASKTGPAPKADDVFFDGVKANMLDDTILARQQFEQFIVLKPEVPDGYYELAKLYDLNKNTAKAEDYIKKAIAINGDNKWFQEEYATILGDEGKYNDAAQVMSDLCRSAPEDPGYPIVTAEYYERARKYPEAIIFLDKAISRNGPDEDILMKKVQIYLDMNKVDQAAQVVEQLIAQNPKSGKYYKELGDIYDNNKMPEQAAKVYQRAQQTIPGDPSVQLGYAEHYLLAGDTAAYFSYVKKAVVNKDLDGATQLELLRAYVQSLPANNDSLIEAQGLPIIRELVGQHPADPQILAFYGEFLELDNKPDSALVFYKQSLAIAPSNFNLWGKVLHSYSDRQDADSLIKYSDKAARLFPTQALVYYYNSIGHYNKKDYTGAIKSMKRAIDLQPDSNPELLSAMYSLEGEIYHQAKQDDASDVAYEKALQLQPDDAFILNNYSYYLSERGKKLAEAERMSKKSLELKPQEATFMDTYGWILYQNGEYEKAKGYIQKAIDMAGSRVDATLYDHLGDVYYKLKDKDKALENWKLAKEKGSDDPKIDKKISEGKLYE